MNVGRTGNASRSLPLGFEVFAPRLLGVHFGFELAGVGHYFVITRKPDFPGAHQAVIKDQFDLRLQRLAVK